MLQDTPLANAECQAKPVNVTHRFGRFTRWLIKPIVPGKHSLILLIKARTTSVSRLDRSLGALADVFWGITEAIATAVRPAAVHRRYRGRLLARPPAAVNNER